MIKIEELSTYYIQQKKQISILKQINLSISSGKTFGLVGESGSGKTTLGKAILQLHNPLIGKIYFNDTELTSLNKKQLFPFRRQMQMVFQHPDSSLDPRMTIAQILAEGLQIHKLPQKKERIEELLELVGLDAKNDLSRYPAQFSGGQRQRIAIARALAIEPQLLILDEPISALDVSLQAQIINMLKKLQQKLGLTYLFISHDLRITRHFCDDIAVIHDGKIIEKSASETLFKSPQHAYTKHLIRSIPSFRPLLTQASS